MAREVVRRNSRRATKPFALLFLIYGLVLSSSFTSCKASSSPHYLRRQNENNNGSVHLIENQQYQQKLLQSSLQSQNFVSELRQLEDENEENGDTKTNKPKSWFFGIEKKSLKYDILEGFFWVSLVTLIIGSIAYVIYWYCCVPCGCMEDYRTDKRRWMRRTDDGRGVFSPLTGDDNSMDDLDSVWDDAASEDSMEYGHSHLQDEYGEINERQQDEILFSAAKTYFDDDEKDLEQQQTSSSANANNSQHSSLQHQHPDDEDDEDDDIDHNDDEDDDDLQVETIDDILEVEMVERNG
mmetsp:Transcript_27857/g.39148  ORF Transcript_27857/g.39148 Transcript_27857/m.39148 type:complete len:296 (+) Transcript_27857:186-1073(+)